MHFVKLSSLILQKTGKIITPEYSQSQQVYNQLVYQLKKEYGRSFKVSTSSKFKAMGQKSKFGPKFGPEKSLYLE